MSNKMLILGSKGFGNSPHHHHRNCMENSVESIRADILWFKGLKLQLTFQ